MRIGREEREDHVIVPMKQAKPCRVLTAQHPPPRLHRALVYCWTQDN